MNKEKQIHNYLIKIIFNNKAPKNYKNLDILKLKKFDSVSVFKILLKIESKYKIKIDDSELFSKKFRKFINLVKLIQKKTS